ncbi:MAG: ABC-2 family transporter protein [Chloroflexota bacterium]
MLKIIQRLWQTTWAEQWQYRANLLMYLLYWLVSPIVYLAVWTSVANSKGSVGGYTANDFVVYYMLLLLVDQLTSNITIHIFPYKIQDGTLSSELIRPIHPLLTNTLVTNVAHKVLNIMVLLPVWGLLWFLFQPDFSGVTWQGIGLALPIIVVSFFISFLLSATISCMAFWTTRVYSLHEFYFAFFLLCSGQFVPLKLMPAFVQNMAEWLPFQLALYFPIELIRGTLTPEEILHGYLLSAIWLAVSYALFRWIWRAGLKQYSAVGA